MSRAPRIDLVLSLAFRDEVPHRAGSGRGCASSCPLKVHCSPTEDDTAVPGNHLAADWLGLLACAEGCRSGPGATLAGAAMAGLSAALREQVNEDGTSFEGSIPYHRLATEIFATGTILAHAARRGVGREQATRLRAMFRATRALLSSRGEIPQIGDDDSGRVLALRERAPTDGGYLLPLGAVLLRDPTLLGARAPGDSAEVAWLLGPDALDVLAAMRPPARRPGSASFPDGGFHVLRRGPFEAFVSCGANGQRGIGGHSHNDKLSVELFANGSPQSAIRAPRRTPPTWRCGRLDARARHGDGGRRRAGADCPRPAVRAARRDRRPTSDSTRRSC
jgi:hypothetical protein